MSTRLSPAAAICWQRLLRNDTDGRTVREDLNRIMIELHRALISAPIDQVPILQGAARMLVDLLAAAQPNPPNPNYKPKSGGSPP